MCTTKSYSNLGLIISKIELINETQNLYQNETQVYKVLLTRAIIFHFENGRELMFEKDDFCFSEEIVIKVGTNMKNKLDPHFRFERDWNDDEYTAQSEHEILCIK